LRKFKDRKHHILSSTEVAETRYSSVKIEMISTGEEVLSGQIVDTNASWFADTLMNQGLELQRRSTVGDRLQDLIEIFRERSQVADVILVNGGLGPTSDDLCVEAVAVAAGVELQEDSGWRAHLEKWFANRKRPMPSNNLKQCLLPTSAILVDNPIGSAPGLRIKINGCWLFFTPGVPSEYKRMVEEQFFPFLRQEFQLGESTTLHKFLTLGHGESALAETLQDVELAPGMTMGYRPSIPIVEIKVFARGDSAIAALPKTLSEIRARIGQAIVSERYSSVAQEVHHLLLSEQRTISLAESCTGGMISAQLIEFAGSSAYMHQGIVCYSNEAKTQLLGVSAATLKTYGAVSPETALEMAKGARSLQNSDFALSVTGIAGPDGSTENRPIGTVSMALATADYSWVQTVQLGSRTRTLIRQLTAAVALDMIRRHLCGLSVLADYPFIDASFQAEYPEN
jgi:nicotinamide-nucleotide amidase